MRDSVHTIKAFLALLAAGFTALLLLTFAVASLSLLVQGIAGMLGFATLHLSAFLIGLPALFAAIIVLMAKRPWERTVHRGNSIT